ncbi:hypothetical protein Mapa_018666 [Marchantia paleacea]|nr:hypothetical protein Mapa_018666 [Marchantia paleacea]
MLEASQDIERLMSERLDPNPFIGRPEAFWSLKKSRSRCTRVEPCRRFHDAWPAAIKTSLSVLNFANLAESRYVSLCCSIFPERAHFLYVSSSIEVITLVGPNLSWDLGGFLQHVVA